MKKTITLLSALALAIGSTAQQQGKKASLNQDGTISVEMVTLPQDYNNTEQTHVFDQLWRFGEPAHPNFKNSRGTTLADIDNDGIDEILYGIWNTLYALEGNGTILFQKTVSGTILLPPSVADLNNDGTLEIVLNTGGVPNAGRVYLLDPTGADLPGWPLNFDDHWMINAPALADLDGDGMLEIITGERVGSAQGFVHAIKMDGTPINANWPVEVAATPAFTPSIADMDNDGNLDVVIAASSAGMYIFDNQGQVFPGFPVFDPTVSYSYQSPILADLDGDDDLEIIGSNHGDNPRFYVMEHDGNYRLGWPIPLSGWTYSPPTVLDIDANGTFEIFMSDRITSGTPGVELPVIYGLDESSSNIPNFPIEKYGGTEGVLSIADVNDDGISDIIFPSVLTDAAGEGYIHAYSLDGSGEIDGFPLRPHGFTFLNGAVLGDVDNDGMLDLTANSYTLTFGAGVDSTFVNVYNLNVPYNPENIHRNGYKGDNTRDGFVEIEEIMGVTDFNTGSIIKIFPNPSEGMLSFKIPEAMENAKVNIYSIDGKVVFSEEGNLEKSNSYNLKHLNNGMYFVTISDGKKTFTAKWMKN
ncbi:MULTISPECIES: T9SS type A sorting domain-containing protein [Aequorivita]|uniref:T9SS type A sorting domain-containing protein n=1 Tax=Aequorivita iocasae TaxID=2803865 RepID=A0ABX7DPL0_9FLAO|nr:MULTISPECIES: T9SS type A sorting domain-containing protein [Aequorivita]QQX75458.1 T9SS type A sorting domain-containing protein [Aequorivita iocasae]UCA54908.1 T9SS type A sorting domain-containing protein [Aequorivita sp. F7]